MRSIGARLTLWYALAATATLAGLFVAGYQLLESRLIHGLDLLNVSEFEQIKAHLGPDYKTLTAQVIDDRIRETTEYGSVLFYININNPKTQMVFYSTNLNGQEIPDVPGARVYNTSVPGIGALRVQEFLLPPFDVTIGTPMGQVRDVMRGYVEVCLALLAGMLIASVAIGFGLSRLMLRPVRLIRETANRIRSDNLSERIPVSHTRDEISDLALLLNQTFDRLEAAFDQTRRFAAEASHELKTPLALVRLHAEKLLVDGGLSSVHEEAVQVQLEELARLDQIIDAMLFLSRAEANAIAIDFKLQDPRLFLDGFAPDAVALAEHHGLRFTITHRGKGKAAFEEKWLRQVVLNLLSNAIHVSPPGGRITLRSILAHGVWRVSVEDEGPGLPADQLERIFERFVRFHRPNTDDKGSGLGLAICRSIITLHHGRIFAEAGTGGHGLRVIFEIPAEGGTEPRQSGNASAEQRQQAASDAGLVAHF
jgi:two-component system heavy metal sensor histidine kinase CusS